MNENLSERAKKAFSLFPSYIQNYIYSQGWNDLREIQVLAAEKIFFTEDDLLIASGTASGKTEAALFPVLSLMEKERDFQVLYISPIKALINNQFERMEHLLRESKVRVHHYHGDISQSHKEDFFQNPKGILQITPESLESLILRRWDRIPEIFSNLRFVIIDEIHALMGSDRGNQILCQLARMESAIGIRPRRIGLSATISSSQKIAMWLSSGKTKVSVLQISDENKSLKVGMESFWKESNNTPGTADRFIYRATKGIKSIVFSNSREETEKIAANLKAIAREKGENDRFYLHHANISAAFRKETEEELNGEKKEVTVLATSSLEYGIDIEKLKRVICQESPLSVSSFLQRLGRSGRRGSAPEMLLTFREEPPTPETPIYDKIPWELLQAIAIVELYRKEKWIEEPDHKKLPASLIFHQTLTVLGAEGPKTAPELAKRILSLPPFQNFEKEDYKLLLIHMLKEDYLELCENKDLVPGLKGEKLLNSFSFLSVFQSQEQFTVLHSNERIGVIGSVPPRGESFSLGGKVWLVEDSDLLKKLVFVRPAHSASKSAFKGNASFVHTKILEKMQEILFTDESYPYLFPSAADRLKSAREEAKSSGLIDYPLLSTGSGQFVLFPFVGTKEFETVRRIFQKELAPALSLSEVSAQGCFFLSFQCRKDISKLKMEIKEILMRLDPEELVLTDIREHPALDKFDPYLPKNLMLKSYEKNFLKKKEALSHLIKIL